MCPVAKIFGPEKYRPTILPAVRAAGVALRRDDDETATLSVPLASDAGAPFEPVAATPGSVG